MKCPVVILLSLSAFGWLAEGTNCFSAENSAGKDCAREDRHSLYISKPLIDCHPDPRPSKHICDQRGCVWHGELTFAGPPRCSFPPGHGYRIDGEPEMKDTGLVFNLRRVTSPTLFGSDVENIVLKVDFQSDYRLRVKIYDPNTERYEVPLTTYSPNIGHNDRSRLYDVTWTNDPQFGLSVMRRDTGTVVFDTGLPGTIFSDQFLQISVRLPSANLYGFGEHNHETLRHDMSWKTWVMFTKDMEIKYEHNLYGVQPFYTNVESDGNTNGVFFKNSNAMEAFLQPDPNPTITFRTIGGILDFYIFLGPTPENVVQQFTEAVGRPVMPPYWSLGFMLSRWGYNSSDTMREVIIRNREAGIPMDVQFGDIDFMFEKLDFTYDKKNFKDLPEIVQDLHNHGQKFIPIVDPAIGCDSAQLERARINSPGYQMYEDGIAQDVYIKQAGTDKPLVGKVWPGVTVFPDFTNDKTEDWWRKWIQYFYEQEGIKFDGLWIDMNEPTSFFDGSRDGCAVNQWNNPPYFPGLVHEGDRQWQPHFKTICLDSKQSWGRHYDVHSLYGHTESIKTYNALRALFPEKRSLLLTRSNYAGTGQYSIHWSGDNTASWEQLRESIIGILEYSLFGFPITGPDICGFFDEANVELCMRWMELGAFYPFSRNHNALWYKHQDPAAFGSKMMSVSRNVLLTRYKLLPYLYTLVHLASVEGSTVARPLFHEFPTDEEALSIDRQFLWGSGLLISPALEEGQRKVDAYFPAGIWYDYYTGEEIYRGATGNRVTLHTPLEHINVHVRGGSVTPWQVPSVTTTASRTNPFGVIIALDENLEAGGTLYWDDGESFGTYESGNYLKLDFIVKSDALQIQIVNNNYAEAGNLYLDTVDIFGVRIPPSKLLVNGEETTSVSIQFSSCSKSVKLTDLHLRLSEPHKVEWISY